MGEAPLQACCLRESGCMLASPSDCYRVAGVPVGEGSNCDSFNCAYPLVDLRWELDADEYEPGDIIQASLMAYSAHRDMAQVMGAVDVILRWDRQYLDLVCPLGEEDSPVSCVEDCAYDWLDSLTGFHDDSELDGLNADLHDGDAFWQGLRQIQSAPPEATPTGACLATFQFEALALTPPEQGAYLEVPRKVSPYTQTQIFWTPTPNVPLLSQEPEPLSIPIVEKEDDVAVALQVDGVTQSTTGLFTFVLTDCDSGDREVREQEVTLNDSGRADVLLENVNDQADFISVDGDWTLRSYLPLVFEDHVAEVRFVHPEEALVSGDFNGDHLVDLRDLTRLGYHFGEQGHEADVTGDGWQDGTDLARLREKPGGKESGRSGLFAVRSAAGGRARPGRKTDFAGASGQLGGNARRACIRGFEGGGFDHRAWWRAGWVGL